MMVGTDWKKIYMMIFLEKREEREKWTGKTVTEQILRMLNKISTWKKYKNLSRQVQESLKKYKNLLQELIVCYVSFCVCC